ncbi:hypothetical protein NE237_025025 [Protea cynaroides]|uniref:Uncharacterized protein n=1 Tax=Protea cynaroides TaxID=273540 RepID=A0A9Q0H2B6_9MAGN|nr:hypothetical protein NE237_025025 [Protea cynaroides]
MARRDCSYDLRSMMSIWTLKNIPDAEDSHFGERAHTLGRANVQKIHLISPEEEPTRGREDKGTDPARRRRNRSPPRETIGRPSPEHDLGLTDEEYASHDYNGYFTITVWLNHQLPAIYPIVGGQAVGNTSNNPQKVYTRDLNITEIPIKKPKIGDFIS